MEQLALCDVSFAEIVKGDRNIFFSTASEVSGEVVIEEGENVSLKIKKRLTAQKQDPDTALGYDLSITNNMFTPELIELIQGGVLVKDEAGNFKSYRAPKVGAVRQTEKFKINFYIEVVGEDGATGEYIKYCFDGCRGTFINPSFKDGEYYSESYTIKSRPAIGKDLYNIELVEEAPEGAELFMSPALQALREEQGM